GKLSAEHDDLIWRAGAGFFDAYRDGKIDVPQGVQLVFAWKGNVGFLGWAGVAPSLPPDLRGVAAYLLGHRCLRLKQGKDAGMLCQTAVKGAGTNQVLRKLAEAELERLSRDAK